MEAFFPEYLLDLLLISMTVSVVLMALVQKFKSLPFIKKTWQVWIINLIFSFALGIPFGIWFYNLELIDSIWVSIFSFIGASTIYDGLKGQNLVNYKPGSLLDKKGNQITIPAENEIIRN